jgi:hypothetical protein
VETQALASINRLQKTGDQWHASSVFQSLSTAWVIAKQESQRNSLLLDISPTLIEHSLANELKALVNLLSTQASWQSLTGMWVTEQQNGIATANIMQNFGVGLDTTKWTLKATTQQGVRSVLNPTLSRWFQTNNWQLQYRQTWAYLMASKSQVPEALSLLHQREGVPNVW